MSAFVVERSLPVEEIGELGHELARLRAVVAEIASDGVDVAYLYSVYIPANRLCFSTIEAPDAATVVEVVRRIGLSGVRVLPAVRFDRITRSPHRIEN